MATDTKPKRRRAEPQQEMTVVILRLKGGKDTLERGFETIARALGNLHAGDDAVFNAVAMNKALNGES